MSRQHWLWLSLATSAFGHGVFGWEVLNVPLRRPLALERDPFEVRMLVLPPPVPDISPEPAAPPPPIPPPPPKPKPKPKPEPEKAPEPAQAMPAEAAPALEPVTAPAALLSDSGTSRGGIVQLAGASIGALATASLPSSPMQTLTSAAPLHPAPLAKLSDLSRRPRAPSLDAALRDNYPAELRRRGTEGQAEVRVVVDARGRVSDIVVVSESANGFAEACRRTLFGSRWSEPLDREGQPVSTRLTYRCRFQIER